jgi:hypothetical protein
VLLTTAVGRCTRYVQKSLHVLKFQSFTCYVSGSGNSHIVRASLRKYLWTIQAPLEEFLTFGAQTLGLLLQFRVPPQIQRSHRALQQAMHPIYFQKPAARLCPPSFVRVKLGCLCYIWTHMTFREVSKGSCKLIDTRSVFSNNDCTGSSGFVF